MSKPIRVTRETFEAEILNSDVPVVVDFWVPWCGPCRQIGPVLDELAATYSGQIKVAKVNVDEEPALAGAFRIQGIPTVVAVHQRAIVEEMVGFRGRQAVEALFASLSERQAAAK